MRNEEDGMDGGQVQDAVLADYEPYKYSGKNYSLDMSVHKPILKNMRRFAVEYLKENTTI